MINTDKDHHCGDLSIIDIIVIKSLTRALCDKSSDEGGQSLFVSLVSTNIFRLFLSKLDGVLKQKM